MKYSKVFSALAILLFSTLSFAASTTGPKLIASIEVTDTFFTLYFFDSAQINEACQDIGKVVFWKSDYPNGYNSIQSAALTAFASGKKVTMWLSGCKQGPWGLTIPKAESIVITSL